MMEDAEGALAHARRAQETYAQVARDQSYRGASAVMGEYLHRPLCATIAEMKK